MKSITICCCVLMAVAAALAEPITLITNYVANFKVVSSTCTNMGDTGLATNVGGYACFAFTDFSYLTETNCAVDTNGTMNALMFGLNRGFYTAIQAEDSTNRPTTVTILQRVQSSDFNVQTIIYTINVDFDNENQIVAAED